MTQGMCQGNSASLSAGAGVWWCGDGGVENEENCGPKASRAQRVATVRIGDVERVLAGARSIVRARGWFWRVRLGQ